jgi:hypothetical protein
VVSTVMLAVMMIGHSTGPWGGICLSGHLHQARVRDRINMNTSHTKAKSVTQPAVTL